MREVRFEFLPKYQTNKRKQNRRCIIYTHTHTHTKWLMVVLKKIMRIFHSIPRHSIFHHMEGICSVRAHTQHNRHMGKAFAVDVVAAARLLAQISISGGLNEIHFFLAFSHSLELCVSVDHLCFSWNHTMASGHCLLFVCLFAYSLRMSIFLRFFADDKEIHSEFRYISMCTLCGVCAVARCKALALTTFCSFHCWFFAHSHTLDAYVCIT